MRVLYPSYLRIPPVADLGFRVEGFGLDAKQQHGLLLGVLLLVVLHSGGVCTRPHEEETCRDAFFTHAIANRGCRCRMMTGHDLGSILPI